MSQSWCQVAENDFFLPKRNIFLKNVTAWTIHKRVQKQQISEAVFFSRVRPFYERAVSNLDP
jgi:hypothetical protein